MFTVQDYISLKRLFALNGLSCLTPLQVMSEMRKRQKSKLFEISLLSRAFELFPGYGDFVIEDFVKIVGGKVTIQ